MKKILITIAMLLTFIMNASAEMYPQAFVVDNVIPSENIIEFIDYNGNVWEWEDIEDWLIGDIGAAIMDDNDTEMIYDDEIIMIYYAGNLEGWEIPSSF